MIEESRRLIFSMDELATAVLSYLMTAKKMEERDKLLRISVPEGSEVTVAAHVQPQNAPETRIEISSQILGAIMIAHCIKRKIPLPKRAAKSIARNGDKVALVLSLP
jgi:hypothetical protein